MQNQLFHTCLWDWHDHHLCLNSVILWSLVVDWRHWANEHVYLYTGNLCTHSKNFYFIVIVDNSQWEGSDKMQLAQFPLLQYNFIGRSLSVFKNLQNLAKPLFFIYIIFFETLLSIWFTMAGYSWMYSLFRSGLTFVLECKMKYSMQTHNNM